jgi:hypothetical protein
MCERSWPSPLSGTARPIPNRKTILAADVAPQIRIHHTCNTVPEGFAPSFYPVYDLISAPTGVFVADVAHGSVATTRLSPCDRSLSQRFGLVAGPCRSVALCGARHTGAGLVGEKNLSKRLVRHVDHTKRLWAGPAFRVSLIWWYRGGRHSSPARSACKHHRNKLPQLAGDSRRRTKAAHTVMSSPPPSA